MSNLKKTVLDVQGSFFLSIFLAVALAVIPLSAVAFIGANAEAATFTVTNLNDSGAGSLRQAITDAEAAAGTDTINFSVSGTITLASTLPTITDVAGLTMDGTGQTVTISGNNAVRVASVDVGTSLTLNNLTIANGSAAFLPFGTSYGGGIVNSGTLIITNSTFSGNSTPSGNSIYEPYSGGGIYNGGTLAVTNSTFSGNSAAWGGGIFNGGTLTVTNSTFSGNSASRGAPIWQDGGGGIRSEGLAVTLRNTIIANSSGPGLNCGGTITDGGNNIDDGTSCGWGSTNGSMSSTNPLLGALANNGGPTQTFALLTGSPAINGVTFSSPNGSPATDQRGVSRPQNSAYDIGAYEEIPVCTPAPSGMVSWWGGDGNPNDIIGTNHGTLVNGATFAPGKVGQAFSFDGVDVYVQNVAPTGLPVGNAPRSIALWFKTRTDFNSSTESALVQYGTPNDGKMFALITSVGCIGKLYFYGHNADLCGTTFLLPDTWYHGAVTYDGSTLKLYLNGQLEASAGKSLNTVLDVSGLTIGLRPGSPTWQGLIDEVEIFDRALSAEEIAAIYNAGSAGKCRSCVTPPSNMVSWWKGENNADDSIDGNNGTMMNGATFAPGMVGQAFSFDGTDDYVELPAAASSLLDNSSGTITAWVKPSAIGDNDIIVAFGTGVDGQGIGLGIFGNVRIYHHTGTYDWQSNTSVDANTWTFLAYAWDNTTEDIYKNGVLSESRPRNFNYVAGFGRIGHGWWGDPANAFPGLIDEVEIYNRALSAAEIAAIANARDAGKCAIPQSTVTANANANGTGNVASNVGGINYNYPADNTGTTPPLNDGTSVVVTAAAGAGSTATWSGTCTAAGGVEAGNGTGTATCTFASLDGNKTATATFTLNQYTVTANANGTGTGNVQSNTGGINYNYAADNTGTTTPLNDGTNVVVTAAAGAGSTASWNDTCTGAGSAEAGNGTGTATCTFASLDGNKTATATFNATVQSCLGTGLYRLWGKVEVKKKANPSGVTMTLAGPGACTDTMTTTLDEWKSKHLEYKGEYDYPTLESGTYTVTPSEPGCTFKPVSQTLTIPGKKKGNVFKLGQFTGKCP